MSAPEGGAPAGAPGTAWPQLHAGGEHRIYTTRQAETGQRGLLIALGKLRGEDRAGWALRRPDIPARARGAVRRQLVNSLVEAIVDGDFFELLLRGDAMELGINSRYALQIVDLDRGRLS